MIEMSPEFVVPAVALVVLTGSLIGSTLIFAGGKGARPEPPSSGLQRPPDWPTRSGGVPRYHAAGQAAAPRSRLPILSMFYAGAVAFLGTTAVITVYQSPWEPVLTLRHMAATLHCDLADQVGLASARVGEPGYHIRNDRDRNGTACEVLASGAQVANSEAAATDDLAAAEISSPATVDTAAVVPEQ